MYLVLFSMLYISCSNAQKSESFDEKSYLLLCKCKFKNYDYVITYRNNADSSLYLRKFYNDSGYKNLFAVAYFKNDKFNGPNSVYSLFDGTLFKKGQYVNDLEEGVFYQYANGRVVKIERYENGKLSGFTEYYNLKGQLKKKVLYKNNQEVYVKRY